MVRQNGNGNENKLPGGYLKGKSWYYDFWRDGERYGPKSLGPISKSLARERINKLKLQASEGTIQKTSKKTNPTLEEFAKEFMRYYEVKNRPSTVVRAKKVLLHLMRFMGKKRMTEIGIRDIEGYKSYRYGLGRDKGTVNLELRLLNHMLNKAMDYEIIKINPCAKIEFFKTNNNVIRFMTEEEEQLLMPTLYRNLRNAVMVAMNTGIRRGELMNIKPDDIDLERNILRVDGKTGERFIPINDKAKNALTSALENGNDRLFPFKTDDSLRVAFWWACKKVKIQNLRFHDLRHTFASRLAMKGVPIIVIRDLLGHKHINMTLRYAHLAPSSLSQAVDLL